MTLETNKALVRRFIAEIFERGRVEAVDELVADDFIGHTWGNADKDGLKQTMDRVAKALADVHFTIDDMVAEGDRVAVRVTASARQVGESFGLAPSGRTYTIGEIHIFRIRDGQVTEHWHEFDRAGLIRQLSPPA
jgi:steroid delta-isomerase-like uncharacterized protein